ncbi:MAG: RteC domain-containing protein [Bacteroidota bacterium]|nr:RteC domain-containing protein [Bacteroidota bacterium]MDP4255362.1 RteC domain-containing protein [Bacteroidota bacterium]
MQSFFLELEEKLKRELDGLAMETDPIIRFDRSRRQCNAVIDELKDFVLGHHFADKVDEIVYFRDLAPPFYSRFFYYNRLFHVELHTFGMDREKHAAFLAAELEETEKFFRANAAFIEYHYAGNGNHDEQWFVRNAVGYHIPGEMTAILDPNFPLGCYLVSKLFSMRHSRQWLEKRAQQLQDEGVPGRSSFAGLRLEFEGSNADAGELIDAFSTRKLIKMDGKPLDTKSLANLFELVFGRKLGNIYDVLHSNRNRKKDPTPFLRSLAEDVQKHSG